MNTANLQVYNKVEVAAHYAVLNYLTPCERLLFELYLKPGAAVLDLGVGGGRTTPYLSHNTSRYVGVDYASEMIRVCREKYPNLEFLEADASDLSYFASGSFDVVVMAYNGFDYVIPEEKRVRCCEECYRVLKPGGIFLFSSHNPRSILVRPTWNRERMAAIAQGCAGRFGLISTRALLRPALLGLGLGAWACALLRAGWASASRISARTPRRAFWRGEGYLLDSAHGGLITHCWLPARVIAELQTKRFQIQRVLGDDYPRASGEYTTDWYYYVFSKSDSSGNGEPCA